MKATGAPRRKRGLRAAVGAFTDRGTDWIARVLPGLGIEEHVTHVAVAHGHNKLVIDHLIPEGDVGAAVAFRITTRHRHLPSNQFPDRGVRQEIHSASLERGRAIFCVRRDLDEVVAAISYHLPDKGALVVRAMALRQDGQADLWAESRWALVVCKAYLHVFAERVGRPAYLFFDADTKEQADEAQQFLGFRPARRACGVRLSGRALLVQPKLGR